MERQATTAEIRAHYKNYGHTVRISKDGHVFYKKEGEGSWLEARWVEEYRVSEEYGVRL